MLGYGMMNGCILVFPPILTFKNIDEDEVHRCHLCHDIYDCAWRDNT